MNGLDNQRGPAKRNSGRVARRRHCDDSRCHCQEIGCWKRGILSYRRGQLRRCVPAVRLFIIQQTMESLTPNQSMKPTAPLRCNFGAFATKPRT